MDKRIMDKKGQEISLTVIIVAVIALLVLVILVAIFTGRINVFAQKTGDCRSVGGECTSGTSCPGLFQREDSSYQKSCGAGSICCVGLKDSGSADASGSSGGSCNAGGKTGFCANVCTTDKTELSSSDCSSNLVCCVPN